MADQWDYYRARQAGKKPPIHEDEVHSGFYWSKASRAGGRVPIAIWRDKDGAFQCRVGVGEARRSVSEKDATERWTSIAENDVSRDDYTVAVNTGTWPDGTPTTAPALPNGSNLPTDPFLRLQAEVEDKIASANAWLKAHPEAKTKTESDYATNLQREVNALVKQADAMHAAEKAPILAATKAIDDKFRFRDAMKSTASALKGIFERFMVAQEQIAKRAAQAKFEAERRAVEIARQEAEKAFKKKMADDPIAALTEQAPELPELPMAPEQVKIQSGGGIGRAAGLKSVWVGHIEDYDAALQHFKDAPDIRDALEKLINSTVRAQKSAARIPGVKVVEERRAA